MELNSYVKIHLNPFTDMDFNEGGGTLVGFSTAFIDTHSLT